MTATSGKIRSALIAGAIAFVIYAVIDVLTGDSVGGALQVALVYFVITAVVAFVIMIVIDAVRRNRRPV